MVVNSINLQCRFMIFLALGISGRTTCRLELISKSPTVGTEAKFTRHRQVAWQLKLERYINFRPFNSGAERRQTWPTGADSHRPPGDDCDKDLDWWFTGEGLDPKPAPEKPLTTAGLPPAYRLPPFAAPTTNLPLGIPDEVSPARSP
jgi:hypothetical protein